MKRKVLRPLMIILGLTLLLSTGLFLPYSWAYVLGDVSGDDEISAYDAALAAHIAVGLSHSGILNLAAAEVSGDGEITAYDAALIAQKAVGIIESFPASKAYYVSHEGSDTNPGTFTQPFKTIEKARDAIRATGEDGYTVYIRGGTYYLTAPLTFTAQDSGAAGAPNTYRSYPGEEATISGGKVLDPSSYPWATYNHNGNMIYKTNVGNLRFNSLFVDDKRAVRAREPDEDPGTSYLDYYISASVAGYNGKFDRFGFRIGDINSSWTNLNQVEVVYFHEWLGIRMPINSVDDVNHVVSFPKNANFQNGYWPGNRYWVENVFEGLDEPGEWYLNKVTGDLYYYPINGSNPDTSEIVVPVVGGTPVQYSGRLLHVSGADYVQFQNLTFEHTDWWFSSTGYGGWQSASALEWYDDSIWKGTGPAIYFDNCVHLIFANNQVQHIGGNGILLGGNGIEIRNNFFSDIGANAIRISGTTDTDGPYKTDVGGHIVTDNTITDFGVIWPEASAILVMLSAGNTISHNLIHDGSYTGITVGFDWTYAETKCKNNIIEYNEIYNVLKRFDDGGGIYLLGYQPGTVVRNNKVHDLNTIASPIYPGGVGGIGLYLDGASSVIMEKNWVYRNYWNLEINPCRNSIVRNNVFVDAKEFFWVLGYTAGGNNNTLFQNIYYSTTATELYTKGDLNIGISDYNTFYNTAGWDPSADVSDWKALNASFDIHSIEQDPLFVDYANDDFTLQPSSPAFALGFQQIDMGDVGPRDYVEP